LTVFSQLPEVALQPRVFAALFIRLAYNGQTLVNYAPTRPLLLFAICALGLALCHAQTKRPSRPEQKLQPETLVEQARKLASEWSQASTLEALQKFEKARLIFVARGDRANEALMLLEAGKAQELCGDPAAALASYQGALKVSRLAREQHVEAAALNRLGFYYIEHSDFDKALEYGQQAKELSVSVADRRNEAEALLLLGVSCYNRRELAEAKDYLQLSSEKFKAIGDKSAQAQVLETLGHISHDLGNPKEALRLFTDALDLANQANDLLVKGKVLNAIAITHSILGEKQQAVEHYRDALTILEKIGNKRQIAIALNGLGYIYFTVAQNERALTYYSRALNLFRSVGDREAESIVLVRMGKISENLWDKKKAALYYEQLVSVAQQIKDPILESYVLNWLGDIYAASDKRRAISLYERALTLSRQHHNPRIEAYTLNRLGYNHAALGETAAAQKFYDAALERTQTIGDREGESLTLYNLAALERDRQHLAEARSLIERSLKIVESLTTDVGARELRASYFATVHQQYEFYIDVLMQLHNQNPSGDFASLALEASERSRARSLLEMLNESGADIRKGVEPQLLAQEQDAKTKLRAAIQKRFTAFTRPHTKQEVDDLQQEIVALTTEYEQIAAEIRQRSPQYAALTQPTALARQQIQALLDDDTVMVEYALGDRQGFAWVVSHDAIKPFLLPGRAAIENLVRVVYEGLTKDPRTAAQPIAFAPALERLSRILLDPIANYRSKKRVVVVADGALQYIPFQVLELTSETHERVVTHHEVVNLPSASALAVQRNALKDRKAAPYLLAIIADPVFEPGDSRLAEVRSHRSAPAVREAPTSDLSRLGRALRDVEFGDGFRGLRRLYSSGMEADALFNLTSGDQAMLALGFDANRNTVVGDKLANYRMVHFATHGLVDNQVPELSGIVLSMFDKQGKRQDGFLQLYEIYNLKLAADLVVLSACQTALGKDIRGEGIVSLTRGFMHAGAPRVVASLWNVDDAATAELMSRFYREMIVNGLKPAAALRAAQLDLANEKRYQSPYFWAAFVIQGEWK
jgi:CHAT domain-containing protein/tetratricopeptide (TPR) repeat protein